MLPQHCQLQISPKDHTKERSLVAVGALSVGNPFINFVLRTSPHKSASPLRVCLPVHQAPGRRSPKRKGTTLGPVWVGHCKIGHRFLARPQCGLLFIGFRVRTIDVARPEAGRNWGSSCFPFNHQKTDFKGTRAPAIAHAQFVLHAGKSFPQVTGPFSLLRGKIPPNESQLDFSGNPRHPPEPGMPTKEKGCDLASLGSQNGWSCSFPCNKPKKT